MDFEYLRSKSKASFKRIVKQKVNEYALKILKTRQETHSKMQNLFYSELRTQDYLRIPGFKTDEAQNLFKWRVRMAPLGENFRGNSGHVVCPLCQNHLDNQSLAFQCEKLKMGVEINIKIEDIFKSNISLKTAQNLTEVENMRNKMIKGDK